MEIVGTCINCLPMSANFVVNAVVAIAALSLAIYRLTKIVNRIKAALMGGFYLASKITIANSIEALQEGRTKLSKNMHRLEFMRSRSANVAMKNK